MAGLDASAVAGLLVELGRRTALAGDNYFSAKAYQRAADTLSALVEPLEQVIAENRLRELQGIGETIADIITKLHRTGTHPLLERLRRDAPEGVLDMLSVPVPEAGEDQNSLQAAWHYRRRCPRSRCPRRPAEERQRSKQRFADWYTAVIGVRGSYRQSPDGQRGRGDQHR